ncbi:alpha/beta fold hydrolase [Mesocricetibacter intestinalis]|nr:alpha/beta hydrolase [Mesocricetibacter intestinalis]
MSPQSDFSRFALERLLPFAYSAPICYMAGAKGCRIAYRHYRHERLPGREGKLVVLVNGRAENMLKWAEPAYEFYRRGCDVLLFDHRGQGYSQRLLKNGEKGYIDEFRYYARDMDSLLRHINGDYAYARQYLLAHSLGALISTHYLADYDHSISRALLSAPFYGVPLTRPLRDQAIIALMLLLGRGKDYVIGKGPYKAADIYHNPLSSDIERIRWMNRINRKYPELRLGGPTFRWVHLCLQAIRRLPQLIPRIEIPVMILQAERDEIVSNKHLAELSALFPQGQHRLVAGAKHEIMFEGESLRSRELSRIFAYFEGE